jgi:hypothetical protein
VTDPQLTVVTPSQRIVVQQSATQALTVVAQPHPLTVVEQPTELTVVEQSAELTVASGVPGPEGPQGPAGQVDGYLHEQTTPAATWIVSHNLDRYPSVSLIADDGELVEADVHYASTNTVTVVFAQAATGKAALI